MAGLPPLLSQAWPEASGRPDEAQAMDEQEAWVEVSHMTVEKWREHAWRGRVDDPDAGVCKGGSSGDDSGPGTASACGESLAERDTTMSHCSSRTSGNSSACGSLDDDDKARPFVGVAAPAHDARAPADGAASPAGLAAMQVSPARRASYPGPAWSSELDFALEPRNGEPQAAALHFGVRQHPSDGALESVASAEAAAARGAALARLRARSASGGPAAVAAARDPLADAWPPTPAPRALSTFVSAFAGTPLAADTEGGDVGGLALPLRDSLDSDEGGVSPVGLRRAFSGGLADPNPFGRPRTAPGALSTLLRASGAPSSPEGIAAAAAAAVATAQLAAAASAASAAAAAADVADYDAAELCCRLSRARQTVDFVHRQRARFCALARQRLSLWDALLALADVPPVAAALASGAPRGPPVRHLAASVAAAEAALAEHPAEPWLAFVALTHALGRLLLLPAFGGEPAWAVVGETFPVGARFSPAVSFSAFFAANPDRRKRAYAAPLGVYVPGAGLAEVDMAWSADEYLLEVLARNRAALPAEGLFCVRYASFAALGAPGVSYNVLMSGAERAHALPWLDALRDIKRRAAVASAAPEAPDGRQRLLALEATLRPLVERFCPGELRW